MLQEVVLAILLIVVVLVTLAFKDSFFLSLKTRQFAGPGFLQDLRSGKAMFTSSLQWAEEHRPKDFYKMWVANKVCLVACSPESVKWVLMNKEGGLDKTSIDSLDLTFPFFGPSLSKSNGADWRRQKAYYNPAFSHEAFRSYSAAFNQVIDKIMGIIKTQKGDFEVRDKLNKLTLDALGLTIFDYDFRALDGQMTECYQSYNNLLSRTVGSPLLMVFPWMQHLPLPRNLQIKKDTQVLKDLFKKLISQKKENKTNSGDILTHLIQASEIGEHLTDDELMANIFIMFLAGHETTSSALSWLLYELSADLSIQEKAYEEIMRELDGCEELKHEDMQKVPYVSNVIAENMRLHSLPVIVSRRTTKDLQFKEHIIPKGMKIGLNFRYVHRDPELWENPLVFDPERFVPERRKKQDRFQYLPFSLGTRQCPGNNFSLFEQHMFIVKVLRNFQVLPPKEHKNACDLGTAPFSGNLHFQFVPRHS